METEVCSRRALVYVASRASIPERPALWRERREEGWRIVSTWIDEAGPGETASMGELWPRIEREIGMADGLILYVAAGDLPLKGALVEVGMALMADLPVRIVLDGVKPQELGSWAQHPNVRFCGSVEHAYQALSLLCR